jgi:two-component system CheB/CheR fusion protein
VQVKQNGETRTVNVEVIPLKNLPARCFLILFDDVERSARAVPATSSRKQTSGAARTQRRSGKQEESRLVAGLQRELAEMADYLQTVQEGHEATNEELQASNEEVQSANEELQSVNEELETSKEELESTNEELTTVNEELANRNVELNRLNSDLVNLQTSTHLAIVLLGRDLTIRRFSVQAEKQFNLVAADVGRPIGNVRHNLDLSDLESFVSEVIASVREAEREVRDKAGRWYSLRVRPYLTLDNKVDGAVMVLVDIDALKRAGEALATSAAIVDSSDDAIISKSLEGIIVTWNKGAERLFGYTAQEAIGQPITMLIPPDRLQEESDILTRLRRGERVNHYETIRIRKDGSSLEISLTISPIRNEKGDIIGASKIARDISERKQAEERQRLLTNELAHRGKNLLAVVQAIVSRSLSGERPLAEAREVLARRIHALARSQSIPAAEGLEGTSVTAILQGEFEAFSDRVEAVGPDLMLNSKSAQTFALLVHELATNASKHGALSRQGGQVAIHWSIEGEGAEARFKFQWQERGGPAVTLPSRQGFGRMLLEKAVAQDFDTQPKIKFAPEGLAYEIDVPLSAMVAGGGLGRA